MKKYIGQVLLVEAIQSCVAPASRDVEIAYWKNTQEMNLILTSKSNDNSHEIDLTGIDITTGKEVTFHDGSGWILSNYNRFLIGYTIIKEKGKYKVFVKRKRKYSKLFIVMVMNLFMTRYKRYPNLILAFSFHHSVPPAHILP